MDESEKEDRSSQPSQSHRGNGRDCLIDRAGKIIALILAPAMFFSSAYYILYLGLGAGGCKKESTDFFCTPIGLTVPYVAFVIFIIYILMSPFKRGVREAIHIATMFPWYFLLAAVFIPQIKDPTSIQAILFIGALHSLKYLCEPLSSKVELACRGR